jgi:membrane protein
MTASFWGSLHLLDVIGEERRGGVGDNLRLRLRPEVVEPGERDEAASRMQPGPAPRHPARAASHPAAANDAANGWRGLLERWASDPSSSPGDAAFRFGLDFVARRFDWTLEEHNLWERSMHARDAVMSMGTGDEQDRGREAEVPSEIPRAGWLDILLRLKDTIREDRITLIAAGVAFYAMLALFPAMIVVVSGYGLVMDPGEIAAQVRTLGVLPDDVRSILTGQLDALARAPSGRLSLSLAFGVLAALWSASAGMRALVTGVNAAYSEAETRGFVRLRGLAIVLTVGGSLVTVLALAVIVALPVAARRLSGPAGLLVSVLRWPLLAAVLIAGLGVLYRVAPSRKDARWQWLSWGSVTATGLLLVASMLCSVYASYAPAQNKTYGAFFGVIVLLFWLFLSAFAVLLGAELNAELELQTKRDTTVGPPRPLGERGAYVADHVAGTPDDPA